MSLKTLVMRRLSTTSTGTTPTPKPTPTPMPSLDLGRCRIPPCRNERMSSYAPGSPERILLRNAVDSLLNEAPFKVPIVINGERFYEGDGKATTTATLTQRIPSDHGKILSTSPSIAADEIRQAIEGSIKAKKNWEELGFGERAAVFLKAADLLSSDRWRYKVLAATVLGQGKNAWQAEIDSVAEMADFWRFNCTFAQQIMETQPVAEPAPGTWNKLEYRPLDGFVLAVSPFNFTAIGGNLPSAPALMGNVVLWKPSVAATLSNWMIYQILEEAGLPPGVIQFIPGPGEMVVGESIKDSRMAGIHFTGSTQVFRQIWSNVSTNLPLYRNYPRLVGETGGKNFHLLLPDCQLENAVHSTIRGAFEYQGQKCSACSRVYVPSSLWPSFKDLLLKEAAKITLATGPNDILSSFMGPVIDEKSFKKIMSYVQEVKKEEASSGKAELIFGGNGNDEKGFFVEPTIVLCKDASYVTMKEEIFGPILSVFVYEDERLDEMPALIKNTTSYALTGSVFGKQRSMLNWASTALKDCCGNFYINDKSTGAIVGQQPFGGSGQSGTNDKAGSHLNLLRWTSPRTTKEAFVPLESFSYPMMEGDNF